jgi:predicted acylesterase/phospholipase RssA
MDNNNNTTFHAGICMAGAISAGAYTAGVMDYLFESLENWEQAKKLQAEGKLQGVPQHNFVIEVLGGASAGGMTAAITAAGIQKEFAPVNIDKATDETHTQQNPLYNSWVNLTETKGNDMMAQMLSTDDIEKDNQYNQHKEVRAGFNSTFINTVANTLLDKRVDSVYKRPYVADDLDFFTTITNLRGYNYKVTFETSSGLQEYKMKMHKDYAFFKLGEDTYSGDGRIPISFKSSAIADESGQNVAILKEAAMSTGAFPVGLQSRTLSRKRQYILDSKYLNLKLSGEDDTRVDYDFLPQGDFLSLNVDGGVINNEPFEVTQQLLDDRKRQLIIAAETAGISAERKKELYKEQLAEVLKNEPVSPSAETKAQDKTDRIIRRHANLTANAYSPKTAANEFESLVIMIDPFPSEQADTTAFVARQAWKNVLPSVLSAMLGQLRMKENQVKRAYLSDDYTRFLIIPDRSGEEFSIACGSLGGFGGFFSKKFREHDFYLGRRNCQRFLQMHFSVPAKAENPILEFGYKDIKAQYIVKQKEVEYLPIIPDIRISKDENGNYTLVKPVVDAKYSYPQIELSYLLNLRNQIKKRIECLIDNVKNPDEKEPTIPGAWKSSIIPEIRKKSWLGKVTEKVFINNALKFYIFIGKTFGKGAAADKVIDTIIEDMEKRGLIKKDI